jgi:hypothetical protein
MSDNNCALCKQEILPDEPCTMLAGVHSGVAMMPLLCINCTESIAGYLVVEEIAHLRNLIEEAKTVARRSDAHPDVDILAILERA